MSFYKQPLTYQCGPFALKYALVMLGKMEDEKDIEALAGSTWWKGTDEIGLEKAANYYECEFTALVPNGDPRKALSKLNSYLNKGIPAVLCVDRWSHWIAVVGRDKDKYVCVDSGMRKVIIIMKDKVLLKRWKHIDKKVEHYAGYAITPWYKAKTMAKFTVENARKLMSDKYEELALHWDSYFMVLAEHTRSKSPMAEYTITFKQFSRRYQKLIVELVADWHGDVSYKTLNDIFENFQFIANIYGMVIHHNDEKNAIINFTCVLTMFATHNYGTYSYL